MSWLLGAGQSALYCFFVFRADHQQHGSLVAAAAAAVLAAHLRDFFRMLTAGGTAWQAAAEWHFGPVLDTTLQQLLCPCHGVAPSWLVLPVSAAVQ